MKRIAEQEAHDEGRGRTIRRRAAREIDKLVLQLIELSEAEIFDLPISPELQRELNTAREIRSRSARRRQLRFVAGMLRASEAELQAIRLFLDNGARVRFDPLAEVRHLDQIRESLCDSERSAATLDRICEEWPHLDRTSMMRLVQTVHEHGDEHKAYREIYKRLRIAAEEAAHAPEE